MRIAIWHNLPSGGGKRALHEHVRGLLARGHEVELWCPPNKDPGYLPLAELAPEHVVPLGPKPAWMRLTSAHRRIGRLRRLDHHARRCAAEIDAGGFDVLFANSCTATRAPFIGRHLDLPGLLYLQEPYRPLYEALPELPWRALPSGAGPRAWLRDAIEVQGLRVQVREEQANAAAFDRILVNSVFSRESVLRAYGLDARVCLLGVDSERFKPGPEHREPFVVGLGGLYHGKGAERTLRGLAAVPEAIRPPLLWIGNFSVPGYQREIEALADSLEVSLDVRVRVSDDELIDTLGRATALLYTPVLEPFGLAPLEAGACETPVVAIAEAGVRETVVDGVTGLLVADTEPEALGRALTRLLEDPALARRLGQGGRARALGEWSWEAAVERLEAQLALLARPSGGP